MRLRKIMILWLLLGLLQTSTAAQQSAAKSAHQTNRETLITILQLNDVYQISPVDKGKNGGLARVATLQKSIREQSPNTLFLLAGDFISPSVASRLFKGRQMIDTLNVAGLDIATLGNHEFDFGPEVLRERMKESRFAYTIANVFDRQTGKPFGGAKPFIARQFHGVRVAIFGLLLAETATLSSPGKAVRFVDPVATGKQLSRRLRQQGFDLIIALTHLPMEEDKRLAAESDVDVIIGGHEHELLESMAGHAPIMKMGSDARNLGRIDVHLTRRHTARQRFHIASIDWQAIPVTDAVKDDSQTAAVIAEFDKQLNASLGEVLGKTAVLLDARAITVRRTESALGNFIADAYRQALQADFALVNSGSIRSDATINPGDLTKKDVLTLLPFENGIVKVKLTGEHLKRLLENGVSKAGQSDGRFPQISGFSFIYDASKPVGSRVTGIYIGNAPLDATKSYTLALSAYTFKGGDGYDLKGAEILIKSEEGPVEPVVVMEAIRRAGTIAPQIEGRIKAN
ncbi:MAG: 5'-nucleotidase C-terminal domain-containing protein [Acidobacteria bacterium]|nr:5'-nucleotidase C-terminal domain-containing protein [Acidobacteriota bacterium]